MSFWSAIGLADRKTLESLMQQIQELKFKNGKLWEENKKLLEESIIWLSKKMQGQYEHVMQAQKTAVSEIEQKIYEAHVRNQKKFQLFEEDFGKLESGQDVLRQEITGHYDKLVGFEDQWLKRLERLSSTFDALQKEQSKVMERLSQLCQDSDQFLEIQKSINDMWEIMKIVWGDSLLDGLD